MISMLCDGATWSNSCEKSWQGRCQTKWCNVQNQFWKQKIIPGQLNFLNIIFWFIICFVLIFSFLPQSISSQRSKGKEIRALKSPSVSWEHKNRGGTPKQANSIWWKEICGTVSNISQYIVISRVRQQYPDLVNMSKVQTRLGALDGIGEICRELLPWMLSLSARPPRPPLDP